MKLRIVLLLGLLAGVAAGVAAAGARIRRSDRQWESLIDGEGRLDDGLDDLVDEMSADSFPSSDPPATWAGRDRPPS